MGFRFHMVSILAKGHFPMPVGIAEPQGTFLYTTARDGNRSEIWGKCSKCVWATAVPPFLSNLRVLKQAGYAAQEAFDNVRECAT